MNDSPCFLIIFIIAYFKRKTAKGQLIVIIQIAVDTVFILFYRLILIF